MLLFPWLSLVAIIWLQSISGTNTDFSAYSCLIKSQLDITQVKLNNLAFASDAGKFFGWLSGIAATRLPLWSVLTIGLTTGSFSYGVQFLSTKHEIAPLSYWQYFLLQVLAGNSICWVNTACYVAAMRKFPTDHGFVIGLATSYTGLTAKIYVVLAQMINGYNSSTRSTYLLLNSFVPVVIGIVTAPFLGETKPAMTKNSAGLFALFVLASVTGIYAVVQTLAPVLGNFRARPEILLFMVMLVAVVPPFLVFQKGERISKSAIAAEESKMGTMEVNRAQVKEEVKEEEGSTVVEGDKKEEKTVGEGYRVWKLVRSVDFCLYFLVYLCGGTIGLVYANNLGQIAKSRGVQEALLLSISSSFGFFGKLSSAPLSAFTRGRYMSSSGFVALLMFPMACSFFLLLIPSNVCLFTSTAIISICSGAITSIAVSMTSDLFGTEHFGVNHNIVVANIPIGSLLFGYIAAIIYDREDGGGGGFCMGAHCYQTTFIIWGSICSFGTMLGFVLYVRTRKLLCN